MGVAEIFNLNRLGGKNINEGVGPERVTNEDAVTLVNNEFKRREKERRSFELQWQLNIAFLEGNQFVDIDALGQELQDIPPLYEWQEREVFNHIAPIIETRIARLSRMRPVLKLRPGTTEPEDIKSAKVGSGILKNVYYDQGVQGKMTEVYHWMEATGACFFKNVWDTEKGAIIGYEEVEHHVEEERHIMEVEDVQPTKVLREGDLDVITCPPQEIYPDSCYRADVPNCTSIIHARTYHIDEIENIWGVRVPAESCSAMRLQRSMVGHGGLGYGMGGFRFQVSHLKDHAIVKEYWEVPGRKYPKGRLIIVAGGKLLHYGELPYPVGKDEVPGLPFTKVECIKRVGVFWPKTVVERLIPLQRRYNSLKNRKAEYLNRAAIGGWWVEEGSIDLDDMEANVGAPGYMGVVQRGFKMPQAIQNAQLPPEFSQEEMALLQEFNALSGVSDLSRQSKAPPGVKSGVAISLALEQDDTRLSATAGNLEVFLVNSGKQWLKLYKKFAEGPRVLRIIGEDNVVELMAWSGANIRSDDVVVEALSAIVESPASRRQMVFDLMGAGLLVDPDTGAIDKNIRMKIFEMLELGNWEAGNIEERMHDSKAERENLYLSRGHFVEPAVYDDHLLHIAAHNRYRLTVEYEAMMQENPMLEMMFQMHVDMHLHFIAPPQQPGPDMMGDLMGGMPGGPGGPPMNPGEPGGGMMPPMAPMPGGGVPIPGGDMLPMDQRPEGGLPLL